VAEHAEEQKPEEPRSVAELTTEIVVAYLTKNTIAPTELGDLIGAVARELEQLGRGKAERRSRSLRFRCAARSTTSTSPAWFVASSRRSFGAISRPSISSRRKPTASSSLSRPTIR
jgi:predicted transcriptional regulator